MAKNLASNAQEEVSSIIIEDLRALAELLPAFLEDVDPRLWRLREPGGQTSAWTLHQTVAHLAAAAEYYRSALELALQRKALIFPGFQQRQDLPAVNQREIQQRQHLQPAELITALVQALQDTITLAQQLTPDQLAWPVQIPVFNRPLTIFELLEMQAMHPGMIHAAQIARPAGKPPLWRTYSTPLLHRMLERWFRLLSLTYWPERGGKLRASIQFCIAGTAGGEWFVSIAPEQSTAGKGRTLKPRVTIQAASADALCLLFTQQIGMGQALLSRKISVRGDLFLATKFAALFSPT